MRYSKLGNSGLIVSQFVWGAANIGTPLPQFASSPHLDEKTVQKAVDIAVGSGINFFDTADLYSGGEAEEILGRTLAQHRNNVVISTKVGMRTSEHLVHAGLSKRHILSSIDGSLRRLNTDWIDIYIAHRVDPLTPLEETLEALDHTVRSGKVRYIGFSNWPAWMVAKSVEIQKKNGWAQFSTGQMYYSLIGREIENDTVPLCLDAGIGLMVWSPLAGGYLSGRKIKETATESEEGIISRDSFVPINYPYANRVIGTLREIADAHNTTPAGIAMAWLFDRPAVASVLLGFSKLEHLSQNIDAMAISLTDEDRKALDQVSAIPEAYPNWFNTLLADTSAQKALRL